MSLTSRERFIKTLNHEDPGEVVVDLGATGVSQIHVNALARLRSALGLEEKLLKVHPLAFMAPLEEDVQDALGLDIISLNTTDGPMEMPFDKLKPFTIQGIEVLIPDSFNPTRDKEGAYYYHPGNDTSLPPSAKLPADGFFFDFMVRQDPDFDLEEANGREDFKNDFSLYTDKQLKGIEEQARWTFDNTDKGIIIGDNMATFGDFAFIPGMWMTETPGLRNLEDWIAAHFEKPSYIHEVYGLQLEYALKNLELMYQAVGDKASAVFMSGTDFGTQRSLLFSRDLYREFYLPYHKKVNDWVHKHTSWKTFYHTCGAIMELLPDFYEAGMDILNPVQLSAAGMDAKILKEEWGDKFVFWGAGSNTQQTLPFGTPEEVYEESTRRLEIFAPGGGFVFGAIHCIQCATPAENILAMFQAVKDYNKKLQAK